MSLIKTRNPNPFPIGIKFGFLKYGGRYKTRTCDLPHVKRMRYQLRQSSVLIFESFVIIARMTEFVKHLFSCFSQKMRPRPERDRRCSAFHLFPKEICDCLRKLELDL